MIGTKLNDSNYGGIKTDIIIFGGEIRRITAHELDHGIAVVIGVEGVALSFYGLDTAENFAAALAEGIAKGRALLEETTP
jgi:hypothetical protein